MRESLPTLYAPTLPAEILEHILSYLPPSSQTTFHAATLVSRSWYPTAIEYLYKSPVIIGTNFDLFVRSVCPSINAHVRHNGLADVIRRLDMSGLVHNGSKSLTARLLGRMKNHLDEFIAPQSSFGVNSLAAISKCQRLRCLDLGFVSEAIPMTDLLRSICYLPKLVLLYLPRASSTSSSLGSRGGSWLEWPANLRELHLNGAFNENNGPYLSTIPPSVTQLWIENCPRPHPTLVTNLLLAKGPQLEYLRINLLQRNYINALITNTMALGCENLLHLSVNIELLEGMWDNSGLGANSFDSIVTLDISCREEHDHEYLDESVIRISGLLFDGKLPKLRRLLVHRKLRWTDHNEVRTEQVAEMNDLLKALAREEGEIATVSESEAGVVVFGQR